MLSYFRKLEKYVPIVARVHGSSHPEFYEVQKLYNIINRRIKEVGIENAELNEEFYKLRELTNNYKVPDDVCESYESVYKMIAKIDEGYNT